MEKDSNIKFLKGKESVFTNMLLLVSVVIFIVPIVLIFTLRLIYKWVQKARESVVMSTQTDTNLNKVY